MIFRLALSALGTLISIGSAHAQTAFEPHTVAYILCVTNETKKLALVSPEIAKDAIIQRVRCMQLRRNGSKKISRENRHGRSRHQ